MDFKKTVCGLAVCLLLGLSGTTLHAFEAADQFDHDTISSGAWQMVGRGHCSIDGGVLRVCDGYVTTGNAQWNHYSLKFRARAAEDAAQVQIWAGFRHYNRDYRYVVALRGGSNNHLYLARYGAEGYDKMLGLKPLEFAPAPGQWYIIEVVVAGDKIAVYLNNEDTPRIAVVDGDSPFKGGGVSLGGSYITTEYDWVKVTPVEPNYLASVVEGKPFSDKIAQSKEQKRKQQRADYRPLNIPRLDNGRMDISLEGNWLFIPNYEMAGVPIAVDYDDKGAHVMDVPNFWVPLQNWLEGEDWDKFNKGQNDDFHVIEEKRCRGYTFDYTKTESAWYRHYIDFPEKIKDKKVVLDFEGISLISAIYVNGVKLHENIGMFMPFKVDITDQVRPGRNVVALNVWRKWDKGSSSTVALENVDANYADAWNVIEATQKGEMKKLESRSAKLVTDDIPHGFYRGCPGGIWRPVKLVISDKLKVEDYYFVPSLDSANIEVVYSNKNKTEQNVELSYDIKDCANAEILCQGVVENAAIAANSSRTAKFVTPKVSPKLWAPGTPNLYYLTFYIKQNEDVLDSFADRVGFRTVEVKGEKFYLNGHPLWIRGATHMPAHIAPNDKELADKFMQLALDHNVIATRTHCSPFTNTWMDAADQAGVMLSYEGTWTWLMLRDIPSKDAIKIWRREFGELIKANRNRPSIFLWTMNNEMKFYLLDDSDEVITEKGRILSDAIQMVRDIDPSRPVVADSAYYRKHAIRSGRYEKIIKANHFDDGDIDDPHSYPGWYNPGAFHFFNGEFGRDFYTPGRAIMSQELSTGYPRSDDALPTRFYLFQHQTPQTTVGKEAYEHCNPNYFITRHGMMTKELLEMFRRVEHDRTCGMMVFSFETWFYHPHSSIEVLPMVTAQCLKTAYQPVLASAELWGRHFYAGSNIDTDVTLINDSTDYAVLEDPQVVCEIVYGNDILASQTMTFKTLDYYNTAKQKLSFTIPAKHPLPRIEAQLVLRVKSQGKQVSKNQYDITIAQKDWAVHSDNKTRDNYCVLENDKDALKLTEFYGIKTAKISKINDLVGKHGIFILAGFDKTPDGYEKIADFVKAGGNAILLDNRQAVVKLLPDIVSGYKQYRHEIVTMNAAESCVFEGIEPLDISWFGDGSNIPYAANGRYSVDRLSSDVTVLAETLEWHGYIKSPLDYRGLGGTPLFAVRFGQGNIIVSQLRYDAIGHDPVAARLLLNILKYDWLKNR
jgi:beta-galactosidase